MQELAALIAEIPDFPKPGILFRDISPLLKSRFHETIDAISHLFSSTEWDNIDLVAGVESRGFLFAAPLAYKYNKGLIKIRKPGKLPKVAAQMSYNLEYGENKLEMQAGNGERLIIIDDLIATGGSLYAAAELSDKVGYHVVGIATLINLTALNTFSWRGLLCRSLIQYGE
jgi:adenine phosphoribosyltransferase